MKNIVLLMMGGKGTRLGAEIPKQYITVNGNPIFSYIVRKYAQMSEIAMICLVSHPSWVDFVRDTVSEIRFSGELRVTAGGENRSGSVRNGLRAVADAADAEDIVLIHDATHPYVDVEGTRAVIEAARETGGATLGACQYDTCYRMDETHTLQCVIPREEIVSGASPEAFRFGDISRIYFGSSDEELASMTSAGAIALAYHIPMKVVPTRVLNLKLTYPEDLNLLRLLLSAYYFPG